MKRALRRALRCEGGGAMLDTALTLPIVLTLFFCFMEACLIAYAKNMITECAREGTRYAMYHGSTCPTSSNPTCQATASQVNTYVSSLGWPNLSGGTMSVSTSYPSGSEAPGNYVQVQVTYSMPVTMPFVPSTTFNLSSTSKARILQ